MSRLGRSQPVQPFATHGFLGNVPPNGTLPGLVLVVEPDDRRRKTPPLQPIIVVGKFAPTVTAASPPAPTVVDRVDRRKPAPDPTVQHGFLASGVGVPGTVPPAPTSIDRVDQRVRFRPLDPVVVSGVLASFPAAPAASPPAPFVVPLDERRRFLASLPPNVTVGYDNVAPPKPNLVEPDRRRVLPLDAFISSTTGAVTAPTPATPPAPFVVPVDERGRFIVVLPATGQHGFVDPGPGPVGTTPPPVQNIDRVDPRYGTKPLDPLVLSGVLAPVAPASAFHDESPMLTLVGLM